jgi:hypothetical protein
VERKNTYGLRKRLFSPGKAVVIFIFVALMLIGSTGLVMLFYLEANGLMKEAAISGASKHLLTPRFKNIVITITILSCISYCIYIYSGFTQGINK